MKARQGRILETLCRVQSFLDSNDDVLGELNQSGARRALDQSIARLREHAVKQDLSRIASTGQTARLRDLRLALMQGHVRPIVFAARSRRRSHPALETVRLPDSRISAMRLVAVAKAVTLVAAEHATVFIDAGLNADFVNRALAAADQVESAVQARNQCRGERVAATKGLDVEGRDGLLLVNILDALVRPTLQSNAPLAAEWKSLKRVPTKPGSPARTTITPSESFTPAISQAA